MFKQPLEQVLLFIDNEMCLPEVDLSDLGLESSNNTEPAATSEVMDQVVEQKLPTPHHPAVLFTQAWWRRDMLEETDLSS